MRRSQPTQPTPRPGSPRRHPRRMRILDSNHGALRRLASFIRAARGAAGRQGILAGVFLAILLAATSASLAGAGRLDARQTHPSGQARVRQARVPADLPAEGHWVDTTDNTAYQVQLKPNSDRCLHLRLHHLLWGSR